VVKRVVAQLVKKSLTLCDNPVTLLRLIIFVKGARFESLSGHLSLPAPHGSPQSRVMWWGSL
jgi:hypothetical protein